MPNFGHWYPRGRVALGLFGYDRRGILDDTHLRFFTRSSLRRLVRNAGFDIAEERATGLPLGLVTSPTDSGKLGVARSVDQALVRARPTLFGYQFVLRLVPHALHVPPFAPHPEDAAAVQRAMSTLGHDGRACEVEFRILQPGGADVSEADMLARETRDADWVEICRSFAPV